MSTMNPKMLVFVVLLYNRLDNFLVHGLPPINIEGFYGHNASKLCRIENNQVLGDWNCRAAGKIYCEKLCDGVVDCVDGSDETHIACGEVLCKETAFRCDYGGCIGAELECNGIKNCFDGSDEKTINCPWVFNKTKCDGGFFQCKNGDCIHEDGVCNGRVDCRDRSDETEELCESHFCPREAFRCNYGACVGPSARCNGKRDCADGSDEKISICRPVPTVDISVTTRLEPLEMHKFYRQLVLRQEAEIAKIRKENSDLQLWLLERNCHEDNNIPNNLEAEPVLPPTMSKDSQKTQIETILIDSRSFYRNCVVPTIRNGHVINNNQETYDHGKSVVNGTKLTFRCKLGNYLIGSEESECINGKLLNEPPVCTKMCSGVSLNTLTVQAACFTPTGISIPCSPLLSPKTIAVLRCKTGYQKPNRAIPDDYKCQKDGKWNAHIYKCVPICGEIIAHSGSLVVGGIESNVPQAPWHAGIHEVLGSTSIELKCSATIISATAIISIAECLWDEYKKKVSKPQDLLVIVGKHFRNHTFEDTAQMLYVKSVIRKIPSDIAVVRLKESIIFKSYIKPICIDFNLKGNQRYVNSGIVGRVAGWGITDPQGNRSPSLKTLDLPTVDYHTCYRESPESSKDFITTDKFCGGSTDTISLCRGDSGAAFAIPRPSEDGTKLIYYLRGIISVGSFSFNSCKNLKILAFTDIILHCTSLLDYVNP